ncbi:MAG: hypothetical protein V1865_02635 [bacterium]
MIKRHKKEVISGIAAGLGGGAGVVVSDLLNLGLLPMVLMAIVLSVLVSIILHLATR